MSWVGSRRDVSLRQAQREQEGNRAEDEGRAPTSSPSSWTAGQHFSGQTSSGFLPSWTPAAGREVWVL
ncbi:hypothetical protein AV530_019443 [Patagioenas fasciata monilis]|uniref:Uncharacterized protein n=1 Tax=Patagioenas fasciata monilis TaxID=372326 RepID=A0A1V4JDX6_PATFA|nr:hypothetical protein AV530_019443 [Patagioenas fasciata monilis]